MKKTAVVVIIIALVLVIGIIVFINKGNDTNSNAGRSSASESANAQGSGSISNTIEITSSGFSPSSLTINADESVVFINRKSVASWPASNPHPVHTGYPGSAIEKCETSERNSIFDACKELVNEESYTFTFSQKGTWQYHDHLNPNMKGTIIVIVKDINN